MPALIQNHYSNPTPITSPENQNKISKPGFHFPYGGEDEDEDSSDDNVSRELSVEIIDSPPPRDIVKSIPQQTPASMKEPAPTATGVEIVASHEVRSDLDKAALGLGPQPGNLPRSVFPGLPAWTSPSAPIGSGAPEVFDLTKTASKEPQASAPSINYVGSSQANPIDLEMANPDTQPEIVSDSDDEPPEILPTSQASLHALPTISFKDPFRYYSAMNLPPKTTVASTSTVQKETVSVRKETDTVQKKTPDAIKPEASVPDSEADSSDADSGYSVLGADMYSVDSSERNWSDDISEAEQDSERAQSSPASGVKLNGKAVAQCSDPPSSFRHAPEIMVQRCQLQAAPWPPRMAISSPITAGGDKDIPSTQWIPAARAPSPSDAALVRPPHTRPSRPGESQFRHHLHDRDSTTYPWFQSRLQELRQNDDTGLDRMPIPWAENASSNPSLNYHGFPSDQYIDPMDRFLPRYDDGPFAGWPYSPPMHQDLSGNFTESSKSYSTDIPRNQMMSNPCFYSQASYGLNLDWRRSNQKLEPADVPTTGQTAEHTMASTPVGKSNHNDALENKPSKLPISDIVNDATKQDGGHARNLKRKADDMTANGSEEATVPEMTGAVNALPNSQDSVLPDAQPRDDFGILATDLDETILCIQANVEELATTVEPPRKKAKVTRTNSKPIKAFISGMLVGCVGLVGACAAFIATIPDAVKEEALREM